MPVKEGGSIVIIVILESRLKRRNSNLETCYVDR